MSNFNPGVETSGAVNRKNYTPSTTIDKGAAKKSSNKIGGTGGSKTFGGDSTGEGFLCPKGSYITHIDGGLKADGIDAINLFRFTCSDGTKSRDAAYGGAGAWGFTDKAGFLGVTENRASDFVRYGSFMGASGVQFGVGNPYKDILPDFWCPGGQKLVGMKGKHGGVIDSVYYMCDWPIDCDAADNTWNTDCDKFGLIGDPNVPKTGYTARRDFCNSDANVNDPKCDSFCTAYPASPDICVLRKNCAITNLTGSSCTGKNVSDLTTDCNKKGFLVGGLGQGVKRPCTRSELDKFNLECDLYKLSRDSCTVDQLDLAKSRAQNSADAERVAAQQQAAAAAGSANTQKIADQLMKALNETAPSAAVTGTSTGTGTGTDVDKDISEKEDNSMLILGGGISMTSCCCILCLLMIVLLSGKK